MDVDTTPRIYPLPAARAWLSKWERAGLWFLLAVTVVFGGIVEMRSVFLQRRMTDVDCYLRAAWAARSGLDFYEVTDTNGWHYNYPPLFAILMAPLANPPPGADRAGMLPYAVSVAVWYGVSVVFVLLAVHVLAAALERRSPEESVRGQPCGCRRWWALRVLPFLICLVPIGHSLSRGQSNPLVLLLFCGTAALLLAGRRLLAGMCLAGAICIKIYPAFLLIHPLLRRDWRCLAGCFLGMVIGLVLIPLAVLGPQQTLHEYQRYEQVLVRPALRLGTDVSRASELTKATATDSQAFMVVLHNTVFANRDERPMDAPAWIQRMHWALSALFTAITIAAGWPWRRGDAVSEVLFFGALIVVMLPISPVCHIHYFIFALPLVMALVADAWERHAFPWLGTGCATLFAINIVAHTVTVLPIFDMRPREFGVTLYATLLLWGAGLVALHRRRGLEPSMKNESAILLPA